MSTTDSIAEVLGVLMAAYPSWGENNPKIDFTLEVYCRALMDIDIGLLRSAAMQHISSSKWFPSVAELREAALSIITHGDESAEEAWGKVKQAIRAYGSYREPQFENDKIAQSVKIMGWLNLCMSENEVADRAHFFKIYQSVQNRERFDAISLPEVRQAIERIAEGKRHAIAAPKQS
jgi:hypothetical protein